MMPAEPEEIRRLLEQGSKLPFAIDHYPSRGQTAVQDLYQTAIGKLFYKQVSDRNHQECRIDVASGTMAEREFWAFQLANGIGLAIPQMTLLDDRTTVQEWLDIPDAHTFTTNVGPCQFDIQNIFECALFDWLSGQIDRHDANYLYDFVNQKIVLIDSGFAFQKYDGSLPDYLKMAEIALASEFGKPITSPILDSIIQLHVAQLKEWVPLRGVDEQAALVRRHNQLKKTKTLKDIVELYRSGR